MRELDGSTKKATKVFVKNFREELDKEKLKELFAPYGKITSCVVVTDAEGRSKGFGFVTYENTSEAEKAIAKMNDHHLEGTNLRLVVCRYLRKGLRPDRFKRKHDMQKRMQRYQGVNLYVKNLDDAVDDETLRKHFETYGKITSAKVMTDENGRSKGYGFVCFEKADDAKNAVAEMNSKMVCSKPLYVALARRKEDRRAQPASQYMHRPKRLRPTTTTVTGVRAQQFNPGAVHGGTRLAGQRFIQGSFAGQPQYTGPRPQLGKLTSAAKPGPAPLFQHYQQHTAQGVEIGGQVPLTTHMLAQADSQEQKQLLGERIYAVIEKMFPGHKEAGKITEMMLDIDNSELIMMLQDIDLLKSKVDEAASVLQSAAERN